MSTQRRRDRHADERGLAAILVALVISATFFALCAVSVDLARMYLEAERVQKAADAAALAGVTWMPQDLNEATKAAVEVSGRNGFPNTGTTAVTVVPGRQPTQLDVSVSSKIDNIFAKYLGIGSATVTRHAVADYTGPQPMGSPCNTMGDEPPGTANAGPAGSQLAVPTGASCTSTPDFWMNMNGPDVAKGNGDEYAVRGCGSASEWACTSGLVNTEFRPEGYFLLVRVLPGAVDKPVTVQLYDPASVHTGDYCDKGVYGPLTNNMNIYAPDATTRYLMNTGGSPSQFCTGDMQANTGQPATVTSFGLRGPSDDHNPLNATPLPGCTRQYKGWYYVDKDEGKDSKGNQKPNLDGLMAKYLDKSDPAYDSQLAQVFHQWRTLCTFTPTQAGDYYLQVRTNVKLGGTTSGDGSFVPPDAATSAMFKQGDADDTSVHGGSSNRFAVRVFGTTSAISQAVSVASYGRMPIFANSDAASSTFNLIRVLPGAAGKTVVFKFFDVGDAPGNTGGTITVLAPTDVIGSPIRNCTGTGFKVVSLPNCSISGVSNSATPSWNAQSETINIPIPPDYSCNYLSSGGCWFRVRVSFTSAVNDTTTWTAAVNGDPVRLIE